MGDPVEILAVCTSRDLVRLGFSYRFAFGGDMVLTLESTDKNSTGIICHMEKLLALVPLKNMVRFPLCFILIGNTADGF